MKLVCSLLAALVCVTAQAASAETKVRVGWCARTVSSAAAPFAIAMKMGWYRAEGLDVELVPLPGSSACTQAVATKEVAFALPSVEPLAIAIKQGVKARSTTRPIRGTSTASPSRPKVPCTPSPT